MNLLTINKWLIIPQLYENQNADEHIEGSKHIYNIRGIRKIFKSGESLLRFNYESTFVFKMYVYIHFIK